MVDFSSQFSTMVNRMLSLEQLWKYSKFTPNEQQEEAIRHIDGPLYLTAGPGSGKTRVLLWRTVNLIVFHGVKPEEIYLSTFTEKAAQQLQDGLRSLLGLATSINGIPYDLSKMYIGTVHSLCTRILNDRRRFLADFHATPTPNLLDDLGQYFHLARTYRWNELVRSLGFDPQDDINPLICEILETRGRSKHEAVNKSRAFFNRASEEIVNPEEAIAALEDPTISLMEYLDEQEIDREDLVRMFRFYQAYKDSLDGQNNARSTDFSLLQQEAYNTLMLRDENTFAFKHVVIDEYQDTNSIQEKIFFRLAKGHGNICVVGDDDQALYRFRGATVENFVEFPNRCQKYLHTSPKRISLSTNYRSRRGIVDFYTDFMTKFDWRKGDSSQGHYRVMDKGIRAHSSDERLSVVASRPTDSEAVCEEVAGLIRSLIDEGKVEDPNQVAFLYPSLGSVVVERQRRALEAVGLQVYAPRAGIFLEVDESYDIFGLFTLIFGLPALSSGYGRDYQKFAEWLTNIETEAKKLVREDPQLALFVDTKKDEIAQACRDYLMLERVVMREGWSMDEIYYPDRMKRKLYNAPGLSDNGKKLLGSSYLDRTVKRRIEEGRAFNLDYIIKRVTSLDWNVLDLFYRLCGFQHFKEMFDLAESGRDEGPVCNLSLISQYLARFVDEFMAIITADHLVDDMFYRIFYFSYLFALFRLGENEYEDAEDPFPKGRIPFLTIHQSKGLEFPVVVLGNPSRRKFPPGYVDRAIRPFCENEKSEPLSWQAEFDNARMFYVALSRAQNLLVINHNKQQGISVSPPFREILDDDFPRIADLDINTVPVYSSRDEELPKMYSYTADFLHYTKCPRQYMLFRKYNFVPSRAQTMMFGSLVHRTLEDLHHEIIRRRNEAQEGEAA